MSFNSFWAKFEVEKNKMLPRTESLKRALTTALITHSSDKSNIEKINEVLEKIEGCISFFTMEHDNSKFDSVHSAEKTLEKHCSYVKKIINIVIDEKSKAKHEIEEASEIITTMK